MSSIRLFILGTLARQGPMHGHQIRRVGAQVDRTELWTDIKVGSVYAALSRMASEGAIAVSHSERIGNRPERTVYEITDPGRRLAALRDGALAFTGLPAEIVDLGVQSSADLTSEELCRAFESRLTAITAASVGWQNQWDAAAPHITRREALTFVHTNLRLEAEAAWCRLVLDELQAEAAETAAPGAKEVVS